MGEGYESKHAVLGPGSGLGLRSQSNFKAMVEDLCNGGVKPDGS